MRVQIGGLTLDIYIFLSVVIIILVLFIAVMLFTSKGKSKSEGVKFAKFLTKMKDEQRDDVAKQISDGATEQFKRFGVINDSIQTTLQNNREETNNKIGEFQQQLDNRLANMSRDNTSSIEKVSETLEKRMRVLQESNERRLEQMQNVVDEKLQKTLETRLSQSFALVSKQLDSVQQGLGEMKNLAADTKSLRNALTNVKDRGTYGEVRLEKLLADTLAPNQYDVNVMIDNHKRVDFVVKLPGSGDEPLLLPIDSKFPIEDYNRIIEAEDKLTIDEARKSLAQKIKASAKDISEKYIVPPKTTDFALMFLPTEGVYAEVVQNVELFEELRNKYKVVAVGATTLSAYLSSLQMGFKTLAMEKRSLEVWDTLRSVKSEFAKFADSLDRAQRQIRTADKTLEDIVGRRTKAINRKLSVIELLDEETSEDTPLLEDEVAELLENEVVELLEDEVAELIEDEHKETSEVTPQVDWTTMFEDDDAYD